MVPRETSQFCFPSSLDISLDFVSGNIRTLGRTKLFPSGPYIKCILYRLSRFLKVSEKYLTAGYLVVRVLWPATDHVRGCIIDAKKETLLFSTKYSFIRILNYKVIIKFFCKCFFSITRACIKILTFFSENVSLNNLLWLDWKEFVAEVDLRRFGVTITRLWCTIVLKNNKNVNNNDGAFAIGVTISQRKRYQWSY